MKKIRIIGVPEHFNYPWIRLVEKQAIPGYELEWTNESRGSGAMNKALREDEADIAIILTESYIKDKIEGNPGLMIGYHVRSPLTWGIHVPAQSAVQTVEDLRGKPFLISRYGSGSHLMAFVLAQKHNWEGQELKFEVVGNMDGALDSFKDQEAKAFLWEKYTTKPLVDQGHFRRVGEIPTPWPCFAIIAQQKLVNEQPEVLQMVLKELYKESKAISSLPELSSLLSEQYQIQQADIEAWLLQTQWAESSEVSRESLSNTVDTLFDLGLISEKISAEDLVSTTLVSLK
ncbi:ABC transporter substrate-binding protein [Echinicola pacifica]|uniref:ABC transporter substrate-binding protein n=1 Tax=Echinicola pacifica TaxID=346377 RepID=A0A918PM53_9BACT|nr:PhnD/SsuA/transferrin family substrate-binding protein [Echinicola pacifica]GGZ14477.1 ABC transporter substrate-binding protein [Echinicola pacifica]